MTCESKTDFCVALLGAFHVNFILIPKNEALAHGRYRHRHNERLSLRKTDVRT